MVRKKRYGIHNNIEQVSNNSDEITNAELEYCMLPMKKPVQL